MTGNYDDIPYPPDYGAPHAMTPTPTLAIDRDKVEMPVSFTIDMCEGTADAVQYRIDRAIERDGSIDAARTGAGMGFGFSLMTQIVGTLQNAAKDLASLRTQLSAATERSDQMQRERAELSDRLNGTPCAEICWQQEREALSAELEAVKVELDEHKADALRLHHEKCDALDKCRALSALIEKAVEALGEAGETLQWIGEARLGLSGPGDGRDRKADAEDIFGVYATLDRLAKLRADLTAAIGKGEGT